MSGFDTPTPEQEGDLAGVAAQHGLTVQEVIFAHHLNMPLERYAALRQVSTLEDYMRVNRELTAVDEAREQARLAAAVEEAKRRNGGTA